MKKANIFSSDLVIFKNMYNPRADRFMHRLVCKKANKFIKKTYAMPWKMYVSCNQHQGFFHLKGQSYEKIL
jgi:hypothetical protein